MFIKNVCQLNENIRVSNHFSSIFESTAFASSLGAILNTDSNTNGTKVLIFNITLISEYLSGNATSGSGYAPSTSSFFYAFSSSLVLKSFLGAPSEISNSPRVGCHPSNLPLLDMRVRRMHSLLP